MRSRHLGYTFVAFSVLALLSAGALAANTYYVGPNGSDSNSGTDYSTPFGTFGKAIGLASAGDTIYALGGTYNLNDRIYISSKSGTSSNPINLWAYPGETPILDFAGESLGTRGIEMKSSADWWHVKGLTIQNAGDNGFYSEGDYGVYEQIVTRYNRDSGFQLHNTASHNLVLNCDSYLNVDVNNAGENADGFAIKSGDVGPGNMFRGDRSWGNSDDGFDTYYTLNAIMIQDCWTFDNGINIWGIGGFAGDGNGFKLGKPGGPSILTNDLAVDNAHNGVDINGNTSAVKVYNTTSFRNARNWRFDEPESAQVLKNNISYLGGSSDSIDPAVSDSYNSWNGGVFLSSADFESLDRYPGGVDLLKAPRQADGSLPDLGGFVHLASGSDLIDAGTPISFTFDGVAYSLDYNDTAPDLGAFETGIAPPVLPGDYNGDNIVDAADYTVWRDNLNTSANLVNDETPGFVADDDYFVWRDHFGESLSSGSLATSAAVPEPGSVILLLVGATVAVAALRRQLRELAA